MRRWLVLIPLLCFACKDRDKDDGGDEADAQGDACDSSKLRALATSLAQAPPTKRGALTWAGVQEACGSSLPPPFPAYYEAEDFRDPAQLTSPDRHDEELGVLIRKACRGWPEIRAFVRELPADQRESATFGACNFSRYDVMTQDDATGTSPAVVPWALHQWLLDQKIESELAYVITRGMLEHERNLAAPVQRVAGLELPRAPAGWPVPDAAALYVTPGEIRLGGEVRVSLEAGRLPASAVKEHLIAPLEQPLARAAKEARVLDQLYATNAGDTILVAADANTPVATMIDLIQSAKAAGFDKVGLIVDSSSGELASLALAPLPDPPISRASTERSAAGTTTKSGLYAMRGPKDAIPQKARIFETSTRPLGLGGVMTIELGEEGMTLSRGRSDPREPVAVEPGDLEAVTAYARESARTSGGVETLVVSADPSLPLQRIVKVIAAARGPECTSPVGDCVVPHAMLSPEPAHGYSEPESFVDPELAALGNLGLIGAGRSEGTIGLGNVGLIGKGGSGAESSGGSGMDLGGKVRQAKAKVTGKLDRDIIRRIVRAHINEVRSCYNAGLAKTPDLAGRVAINFVITGSGKVGSSVVQENSLKDSAVSNCIAKAVKRWKFPKPPGGGNVIVTYPFVLSPG